MFKIVKIVTIFCYSSGHHKNPNGFAFHFSVTLYLKLFFMKKWSKILLIAIIMFTATAAVNAQCSICTKTAGQLGEKSARSLNSGIIYLMLTPLR